MRLFASIVLAASLLSFASAETVQKEVWNIPDGSQPDLTSSFTQGTTLPLSWNGWLGSNYINGNDTLCDLWCASWDPTVTGTKTYLLTSNLNITKDGAYNWPISISDDDLATTAKWFFKFLPHSASKTFSDANGDISSTGFIVLRAADPTSTSSAASPSMSSTTSHAPTGTKPLVTNGEDQHPSSGLSTGAKAGIGVGVSLGALAVIGALVFWFVRRRAKRNATPPDYSTSGYAPQAQEVKPALYNDYGRPTELSDSAVSPLVELPGNSR